jgi:hypothetical protein
VSPRTLFLQRWSWPAGRRAERPDREVCVPNIGPRERRRRLVAGVVMLAIGALAALALALTGAERGWALALLLPFWGGASGVFQAREKT